MSRNSTNDCIKEINKTLFEVRKKYPNVTGIFNLINKYIDDKSIISSLKTNVLISHMFKREYVR